MKYLRHAPFAAIALTAAGSAFAYSHLPARVVSHWDASGVANGTMPRSWAVALVPLLMLFILVLFRTLPRLDPLKENIKAAQGRLDAFLALLMLFFAYVQALTLAWNLGVRIDIVRGLIPAMAALFYSIGSLLPGLKRNWFMGIRTPWTISDDSVWHDTHVAAGKAFKTASVLMLAGLLVPAYAFLCILVPIVSAAGYSIVKSYLLYRVRYTGR